jgi:YD repeat-containing protein
MIYGPTLSFGVQGDGISVQSAAGAIAANTWYHVAVARQGSNLRMFINGVLVGTSTNTTNSSSTGALFIGRLNSTYPENDWNGYIDDFRISKGVARYTTSFAPPGNGFASSLNGTSAQTSLFDQSVPNRVQTWTYNQHGQVLTAKGPRTDVNDTTTFVYFADTTADHTLGDLQSVTNAAGKTTTFTKYNKHGQVLESSDANGVLTVNTYDPRQRLLSTTVAGQTTAFTYDGVGQLKTTTLPNGAVITNSYDDAHRLTQVQDAAGNKIVYTLDNEGNRIGEQVKDASGTLVKNITRSFDALNRLQSVTGAAR